MKHNLLSIDENEHPNSDKHYHIYLQLHFYVIYSTLKEGEGKAGKRV